MTTGGVRNVQGSSPDGVDGMKNFLCSHMTKGVPKFGIILVSVFFSNSATARVQCDLFKFVQFR